jgi:hypothetical protein
MKRARLFQARLPDRPSCRGDEEHGASHPGVTWFLRLPWLAPSISCRIQRCISRIPIPHRASPPAFRNMQGTDSDPDPIESSDALAVIEKRPPWTWRSGEMMPGPTGVIKNRVRSACPRRPWPLPPRPLYGDVWQPAHRSRRKPVCFRRLTRGGGLRRCDPERKKNRKVDRGGRPETAGRFSARRRGRGPSRQGRRQRRRPGRQATGGMLRFTRNRLPGSTSALTRRRRS